MKAVILGVLAIGGTISVGVVTSNPWNNPSIPVCTSTAPTAFDLVMSEPHKTWRGNFGLLVDESKKSNTMTVEDVRSAVSPSFEYGDIVTESSNKLICSMTVGLNQVGKDKVKNAIVWFPPVRVTYSVQVTDSGRTLVTLDDFLTRQVR